MKHNDKDKTLIELNVSEHTGHLKEQTRMCPRDDEIRYRKTSPPQYNPDDMSQDDIRQMWKELNYLRKNERQFRELIDLSEEKYKTIFENTGTSMLLIEEDMTIKMANSEFMRRTGLTSEQIKRGVKWTDYVHDKDLSSILELHTLRSVDTKYAHTVYEFRYKTNLGDDRDTLLNIQTIPGTGKSVASLIDITRLKKAEHELRISEEKFRTLAESSPLAIMMHQGSFWIYANKAASDISGYSLEELYSMNFWDFVHPDYKDLIIRTGLDRQKGTASTVAYEFKIITKTGSVKWVSLTGSRIKYEEKPTALISVSDITDRKESEIEKAKLESQLQQAKKLESIGRLAGGVAHDFNNMLGVILGYAEMALIRLDPQKPEYSYLKEIKKAGERSANLTRQLLAFARKQTVAPQIMDLNETVEGMLNMIKRLIGEDIRLNWQPGKDLWLVKIDPSQIDQIIVNLCVNARDAIEGIGNMAIEIGNTVFENNESTLNSGFMPGEYVLLSVTDDGCGMDEETMTHIFEPFFTTKEAGKGTGLGLATVYGAVRQNNGFIKVDSRPDRGTTITIYLPRHIGKSVSGTIPYSFDTVTTGKETVLLVEDEPSILEVTIMMLEMNNYNVIAAVTPGEAIRRAREHSGDIHLLLTDVVMPEMNGRELAKNILSLYPGIKRLFMSGYTADVIAHQGILDEGVHFIQKPFSSKDLVLKIREALNKN